MDKRTIAIALLVVAVVFLVFSLAMTLSFADIGNKFNVVSSGSAESSGGQVLLNVEGNNYEDIGP